MMNEETTMNTKLIRSIALPQKLSLSARNSVFYRTLRITTAFDRNCYWTLLSVQ